MRRPLAAIFVAALTLSGTAACGSDSDDAKGSADAGALEGVTVSGDFDAEPKVEFDGLEVSGTKSATVIEGDGPTVEAGEAALVNLYIVNATTGKQAYSTFDADRAQEVSVTPEGMPGGLDEALVGQKRGSRIVTAATVEEAIGPEGAEQVGLGKDDDVIFVTDIVSVHPRESVEAPEGDETTPEASVPKVLTEGDDVVGFDFSGAPKKPSGELEVVTLVEGDGAEIPADPTYVTFNYFGAVYGAKKPFDESFSKEPATFPVGNGGLIAGWDEALVGVKAGSRVLLVVPADKGYGEQGQPPTIPGNATLVFVIDVLGVDA